jgi:hypothetical protein
VSVAPKRERRAVRSVLAGLLAPLALACTSVTVMPVDASVGLRNVCIVRNPEVIVDEFLDVLSAGFRRHGIATEIRDEATVGDCEFVLRYTALRSWDLAAFVSHAELHIERSGEPVAHAIYHLRGKGGYAVTKYQSTKKKMDPVIDELLAQCPPRTASE